MGFRDVIKQRLDELGMKKNEFAAKIGVSDSYVYKLLLEGKGNRNRPSDEVLRRIAGVLDLKLSDLTETVSFQEWLMDELYALPQTERAALRSTDTRARLLKVCELMLDYDQWSSWEAVAEQLGLPFDTLEAIRVGVEPNNLVIKTLEMSTGLSVRFWIRGRLDAHPKYLEQLSNHEDAAELLELVRFICDRKVPTSTIKDIVAAVAKGGAN